MFLNLRAPYLSLLLFCLVSHETLAQENEEAKLDFLVTGLVVDEAGNPSAGADISVRLYQQTLATKTDADGKFELPVPKDKIGNRFVRVIDSNNDLMGVTALPSQFENARFDVGEIQLSPPIEITINVADQNDQPVAGADVGVIERSELLPSLKTNEDGEAKIKLPLQLKSAFLFAKAAQKGLDYMFIDNTDETRAKTPLVNSEVKLKLTGFEKFTVTLTDSDKKRLAGLNVAPWLLKKPDLPSLNLSIAGKFFEETTDENGVATFDWIPKWNSPRIVTFWPRTKEYTTPRIEYFPDAEDATRDLKMTLHALVPVSGTVSNEAGEPLPDLKIRLHGRSYDDHDSKYVTTKEDGSFSMLATPDSIYIGELDDDHLRFAIPALFTVKTEELKDLEFRAMKGHRLIGQVTEGSEKIPVVGVHINLRQLSKDPSEIPNAAGGGPLLARQSMSHRTTTDSEGKFEFTIGNGSYVLVGHNTLDPQKFEVDEKPGSEIELNFHATRSGKVKTRGIVFDSEGNPLANASVLTVYKSTKARGRVGNVNADHEGRFEIDRETHPCALIVSSKDKKQKGIVELTENQKEVEIHLSQIVTVTGRLVDTDFEPLPEEQISIGYRVMFDDHANMSTSLAAQTVKTDMNGEFQVERLIQGQTFTINYIIDLDEGGRPSSWRNFQTVTPRAGQTLFQMRDLVYDRETRPVTRPQTDWKINYADQTRAGIRYMMGLKKAKSKKQNLLLIFANPESESGTQFGQAETFHLPVQRLMQDFETLHFDISNSKVNRIEQLTGKLDIEISDSPNGMTLVAVDQTGNVNAQIKLAELKNERGLVDLDLLGDFLSKARNQLPPAQEQFDTALAAAKSKNKTVLIQASAGWCKRSSELAEVLENSEQAIADELVWLRLDVGSPGAKELLAQVRGNDDTSLPWYGMLDSEGNLLNSSCDDSGENLGFPWNTKSVNQFRKVLQSGTEITDESLDAICESIESTLKPHIDE